MFEIESDVFYGVKYELKQGHIIVKTNKDGCIAIKAELVDAFADELVAIAYEYKDKLKKEDLQK